MVDRVVQCMPEYVKTCLERYGTDAVEEIRLRAGYGPCIVDRHGRTHSEQGPVIKAQELEQILQAATQRSVHSVIEQLRRGFISLEGGHRLGVCGTGVAGEDGLRTIREISSLNLRLAREIRGCAGLIAEQVYKKACPNVLILSPPGVGKTTYLRDLIRILSWGELGAPVRVGVADERGEIAAVWRGEPQMDLGPNTDIMSGCRKSLAIEHLTRAMNPQILAVDEITAEEDVEAMERASGCGVFLLATAHARSVEEMKKRPLYQRLLCGKCFDIAVVLKRHGTERMHCIESLENTI